MERGILPEAANRRHPENGELGDRRRPLRARQLGRRRQRQHRRQPMPQAPALAAWGGRAENATAAQAAFLERARLNGLARDGRYEGEPAPAAG